MSFKNFPEQEAGIALLQRALERGRLAHGYLFIGGEMGALEGIARTLAKTLNCENPIRRNGIAVDCCDACLACRKIEHDNHPDVHWARPESKTRVIVIDQLRELMQDINLKPKEAEYKVCVVVAADRMNEKAANAFLKTLEEPPAKSVLVLLTSEPQRILETILSRCLRLTFGTGEGGKVPESSMDWLGQFSELAAAGQKTLLGRYRLLDVLLQKLNHQKAGIEEDLAARSPLEQHPDAEQNLRDRWEAELKASIEAEYRRQRSDLLVLVEWWLRDIWLRVLALQADGQPMDSLLRFPQLSTSQTVAGRLTPPQALENLRVIEQLQRWLHTNVQEALALEVGLLKLHL